MTEETTLFSLECCCTVYLFFDSLFQVNFGDIYIPPNFDFPQPHVIGSILGQGVSSGPIVVVDAQTILVPDFSYDGQAPGTLSTLSILSKLSCFYHHNHMTGMKSISGIGGLKVHASGLNHGTWNGMEQVNR